MMETNKGHTFNSRSWISEKEIIICSIVLLMFSVINATTLWGLGLGVIEEVNPIMRWLIEKSPIVFMTVKLSLPVALGLVFWRIRNRSRKFVPCSLGLVLIVYSVVMVSHVYWIINF